MGKIFNRHSEYIKIISGVAIVALLFGLYWFLSESGNLSIFMNRERLQEYIVQFGLFGPVTVIVLMTGAVVFSPLPSAPIALAAGAVFGHALGTAYVLIGAEAGALIAFTIARILGHDMLHKWFGKRLSIKPLESQNALMAMVFVSRLIPFISFDIVSYAAGLTSLSLWRFAVATFAGIIPASFLLAHFGSEVMSADSARAVSSIIILSVITLVPLIIGAIKRTLGKMER